MIAGFFGEYRFLSNFWWYVDEYGNRTTVEHLYQASKADNEVDREQVLHALTPGQAKKIGRSVKMVYSWDDHKTSIMLDLVRRKFRDPNLRQLLLNTGDQELIELNISWACYFTLAKRLEEKVR